MRRTAIAVLVGAVLAVGLLPGASAAGDGSPAGSVTRDSTAIENAAMATADFIENSDWNDRGQVSVSDDGSSFVITGKSAEPASVAAYVREHGYGSICSYRSTRYSLAELDAEEQRLLNAHPDTLVEASTDGDLSKIVLTPNADYYDQRPAAVLTSDERKLVSVYPVEFTAPGAPSVPAVGDLVGTVSTTVTTTTVTP